MTDSVSIDLAGALPYLEDKVLQLLGRGAAHMSAKRRLEQHLRVAAHEAGHVQVVGMDQPVSIFDIYQPTRLCRRRDGATTNFADLLEAGSDALILAGPGCGKTMLMRFMFATLCKRKGLLPLLFTLRWQDAVEDLATFVAALGDRTLTAKKDRIVLLIDGFDEIAIEKQQTVGAALRDFAALNVGNFYITCRSYYSTDDVSAPHWNIAPFTPTDTLKFVQAFARSYGTELDAAALIADLRARGFDDFLQHPLMLALVCILKSGPMPDLPRTTIGLIRRAIDTLTFRWDEAKRISRVSRFNLDGDERVRCLIRIAFEMASLIAKEDVVTRATREHLRLVHRPEVNVEQLLEELAQWYGLLIPLDDCQWSFTHRSIHDYLAARFWVETHGFDPDTIYEWNTRAAYAACLTNDATRSMVRALQRSSGITAIAECLSNGAPFDVDVVAEAVVEHFHRCRGSGQIERGTTITVTTAKDVFSLATKDFLYALVRAARSGMTIEHDIVLWCAVAELTARRAVLSRSVRTDLKRFGGERVNVTSGEVHHEFRMADVLRS